MTTSEARKLFRYDRETGCLYWRVKGIARQLNKPVGWKEKRGWRRVEANGERLKASHIVLIYHGRKIMPGDIVDHKNRVRDDDRLHNLRITTPSGNRRNSYRIRDTKHRVSVCLNRTSREYRAYLYPDGYKAHRKVIACGSSRLDLQPKVNKYLRSVGLPAYDLLRRM